MLIISVKDQNFVYLLAESYDEQSIENNKLETNSPIFIREEDKETIFINSSHVRSAYIKAIPLLTKSDEYEEFNKRYLSQTLVKRVISYLDEHNYTKNTAKNLDMSLVIAHQDKCYFLGGFGAIREIGEVEAYSPCNGFITSSLKELKDLSVVNRMLLAAYFYHTNILSVHFPLRIISTKDQKIKMYYEEDLINIHHLYLKGELK